MMRKGEINIDVQLDQPAWIAQFVDGLFVNGSGQKADRLVLVADGPPSRDLGGWCKQAIADRLMVALASLPNGTVVSKWHD